MTVNKRNKLNNLNWVFDPEIQSEVWTDILIDGDCLFTGNTSGNICCLNKKDGSLKWTFSLYDPSEDEYFEDYYEDPEFDEYGNEFDAGYGYETDYSFYSYSSYKNDKNYGGNLEIIDGILIVRNYKALWLLKISTGELIVERTLATNEDYALIDKYFAYSKDVIDESWNGPDDFKIMSSEISTKENVCVIQDIKTGEKIFDQKITTPSNLESFLHEYLIIKDEQKFSYLRSQSIINDGRYEIRHNNSKFHLYDIKDKKCLFHINDYYGEKLILIENNLVRYDEFTLEMKSLPSLNTIWEINSKDIKYGFSTEYSKVQNIEYNNKPLIGTNQIDFDSKTERNVSTYFGSQGAGSYLKPFIENGVLFSGNMGHETSFALNPSTGKEFFIYRSWNEIFNRIFYENNLKSIIKFIIGIILGRFNFKKLTDKDFPYRWITIGNDGKYIYCFDNKTKKIDWCVEAGRYIRNKPVTDIESIYIGCNDGKLYSFKKNIL